MLLHLDLQVDIDISAKVTKLKEVIKNLLKKWVPQNYIKGEKQHIILGTTNNLLQITNFHLQPFIKQQICKNFFQKKSQINYTA